MKFACMLAAAVLLTPATVVQAQERATFVATTASAAAKATPITRSTAWSCTGTTCVATKASGSYQTMCQLLVRQVGPLTAFQARGASFDADQLAKCNTAAR